MISLLVGTICPAKGALLITQRRVLLANLMVHSVLPGFVIALAIGIDPSIGGLVSGFLGAFIAERLNRRFKGREEGAMNTVLAGFTALGVLLVPLLEARVDLETVLFGDLLAANSADLMPTGVSATALLAMVIWDYRNLVFIGRGETSCRQHSIDQQPDHSTGGHQRNYSRRDCPGDWIALWSRPGSPGTKPKPGGINVEKCWHGSFALRWRNDAGRCRSPHTWSTDLKIMHGSADKI